MPKLPCSFKLTFFYIVVFIVLQVILTKSLDWIIEHTSTTTPYPIQFGSDDWITMVCRTTGTFTGQMTLPDGKVISPTGKSFDLDFATTARWEGNLLIEEFVFWDSALQAQQIGLA